MNSRLDFPPREFPMTARVPVVLTVTLLAFGSVASAQIDVRDTRFLGQPSISSTRIVFTYADDLWTSALDGSDVKRLTSHPGVESAPFFSPDGKTVAFTGQYDGNVNVYIVPTEGGVPTRLTYHPGPDLVRGWTPEGKVLFASPRTTFSNRYMQFFTVGTKGARRRGCGCPMASRGAFLPMANSSHTRP